MSFWKKHRKLHIWLAVDLAVLGLYLALRQNRQLMNSFADHVTTPLKAALGRLCALTSLSVMEGFIYPGGGGGCGLYRLVCDRRGEGQGPPGTAGIQRPFGRSGRYFDSLRPVLSHVGRELLDRQFSGPFRHHSPAGGRGGSEKRDRLFRETADTVPRDENGVYAVPKEQILSESRSVYGGVTELFPFLEFPDTGVKAVRCSRFMSVMGFTGMYFACMGESNVNVDSPACLLPSTIAHELAHQRGVAWEQECNFLGVLASVTSGMPDYIYSGWLLGFIHLGNALYETDPEAYWAIRGTLPAAVEADLRDNSAYWDQFRDNVVEKVSDTVYDAALKSYGDANGMKSYSMVVELLVAYYKDLI